MARSALTARALDATRMKGRYSAGDGLYLVVTASGSRSWVLRYQIDGSRHDKGLGSYPAVSIGAARTAVLEVRRQLAHGVDPLARANGVLPTTTSFREIAESFIKDRAPSWRSRKTRMQWERSLLHVSAPLGNKAPTDITAQDVLAIVRPLWTSKPSVAYRTRYRIEAVLDAAKVLGLRTGENVAAWRGNLGLLLPPLHKTRTVRHHAAPAIDAMPKIMKRLSEANGRSARVLRFIILTGVRSTEATAARRREIDLDRKTWSIPKERTKSNRAHAVPLSPAAVALLHEAGIEDRDGDALVFPGYAKGRPLSQSAVAKALARALKAIGAVPATVHGCRSTLRDWASEIDESPDELGDAALAHQRGNSTRRAYARGTLFERRRKMLERWCEFCLRPCS